MKGCPRVSRGTGRAALEEAEHRHRLLRARGERPRSATGNRLYAMPCLRCDRCHKSLDFEPKQSRCSQCAGGEAGGLRGLGEGEVAVKGAAKKGTGCSV